MDFPVDIVLPLPDIVHMGFHIAYLKLLVRQHIHFFHDAGFQALDISFRLIQGFQYILKVLLILLQFLGVLLILIRKVLDFALSGILLLFQMLYLLVYFIYLAVHAADILKIVVYFFFV